MYHRLDAERWIVFGELEGAGLNINPRPFNQAFK